MVRTYISLDMADYVLQQAYKSGSKAVHVRDYELGRLEGSGSIASGGSALDKSTSQTLDYVFDRAQIYFTRTESRNIKLSDWDGTRRYEIFATGVHSGLGSKMIYGGWQYVIPSGHYVRLEISGASASGYAHYGVYTETL